MAYKRKKRKENKTQGHLSILTIEERLANGSNTFSTSRDYKPNLLNGKQALAFIIENTKGK